MYLSVIIPAYNEEKRISTTLIAVNAYLSQQSYEYEILVANDGSTDKTTEIVEGFQKTIKNLALITIPKNGGKGYAVQQGILASHGDYCLFMDADNSTSIEQVEKLLAAVQQGFDVVVSSRYIKGAVITVPQPPHRVFLSSVFKFFVRALIPTTIKDTQNGFKLFRRPAAFTIFSQQRVFRWAFDVEILAIARKLNFKIKEVPIIWKNDDRSQMNFKGMVNMALEVLAVRKNLWMGHYYRPVNIQSEKTPVSAF